MFLNPCVQRTTFAKYSTIMVSKQKAKTKTKIIAYIRAIQLTVKILYSMTHTFVIVVSVCHYNTC